MRVYPLLSRVFVSVPANDSLSNRITVCDISQAQELQPCFSLLYLITFDFLASVPRNYTTLHNVCIFIYKYLHMLHNLLYDGSSYI